MYVGQNANMRYLHLLNRTLVDRIKGTLMTSNTLRLVLLLLIVIATILGFYVHSVDQTKEVEAHLLQEQLENETKNNHQHDLAKAVLLVKDKIVSINAYPNNSVRSDHPPTKSRYSSKQRRSHDSTSNVTSKHWDSGSRHLGTGVIVESDGLILTNADIVKGYSMVHVQTSDKHEYSASIIGVDELTHTALLRVDAIGLARINPVDSLKVQVGDPIIAIAYLNDLEPEIRTGVIAGNKLTLPNNRFVPYIPSSLGLTPAWSGSLLVNAQGDVIGINQRSDDDAPNAGTTYSIPIDLAMEIEQQLIKDGHVKRGRLGISIQPVNQSLARSFALSEIKGALVSWVPDEGPGAEAGLKTGDVILKINETTINDANELPPIIANLIPGTATKITLWRNRETQVLTLNLGEQDTATSTLANSLSPSKESNTELGLTLTAVQEKALRKLGLPNGMKVTSSKDAAAMAGIEVNDIIININGQAMNTSEDLRAILNSLTEDFALLVFRDEHIFYVGASIKRQK